MTFDIFGDPGFWESAKCAVPPVDRAAILQRQGGIFCRSHKVLSAGGVCADEVHTGDAAGAFPADRGESAAAAEFTSRKGRILCLVLRWEMGKRGSGLVERT